MINFFVIKFSDNNFIYSHNYFLDLSLLDKLLLRLTHTEEVLSTNVLLFASLGFDFESLGMLVPIVKAPTLRELRGFFGVLFSFLYLLLPSLTLKEEDPFLLWGVKIITCLLGPEFLFIQLGFFSVSKFSFWAKLSESMPLDSSSGVSSAPSATSATGLFLN